MKVRRGARPLSFLILAVILVFTLAGCSESGAPPKVVVDLIGATKNTPVGEVEPVVAKWGRAAPNRVLVMLAADAKSDVAAKAAETVGGKVVGEIGYLGVYAISIEPTNAAGLERAADAASKVAGVEEAIPDLMAVADAKVEGVPCSVIKDDPVYAGANARPYEMIGVERAWAVVRASGLTINPVTVGVADSAFYLGQTEFQGDNTLVLSDPLNDSTMLPTVKGGKAVPHGAHGDAVVGIIGARADNGGQVGITAVLGNKRKTIFTRVLGGKYGGSSKVATDAADPTQDVWAGGAYQAGALVALLDQVKQGATAINISWGVDPPGDNPYNRKTAKMYKRFFEKMSKDYPKVVFVCSAGNNGVQNGAGRWPSGANLPNVITVGNLDNDGSKWSSSNTGGPDSEVTIAAPGHRVVSGVGADGTVDNSYGGTSFATPQVTSAIAIMQSLDPDLTAAQIKQILLDTKTTDFTDPKTGKVTKVPEGVGGGCVSVDRAVLKVVNQMRTKAGLAPLTMDNVSALNRVDLFADGVGSGPWVVTAGANGPGTATDLAITLNGQGAVSGAASQPVKEGGTATWDVTVQKDAIVAHVRRADTGACSRVQIGQPPLVGTWSWTVYHPQQNYSPKTGVDLKHWTWKPSYKMDFQFYEKDGVLFVKAGWPKEAQVTVEGTNVSFVVYTKSKQYGDWTRDTYKGVLEGNTITGTVHCEEWMDFPPAPKGAERASQPKPYTGKWTATKVK